MKRDSAHGVIVAVFGVTAMATAAVPHVLANNTFLTGFVNHEIMAFLIVVLTITMASVANIHLSISRLTASVKDPERRKAIDDGVAKPLRGDIESSARLLFWSFGVCAVALVVKGEFSDNVYVVSATHGIGIVVTVTNVLVLFDIYKTVSTLASLPAPTETNE